MKSRILVVDDEVSVHETVRDILGTRQYEFYMCTDKSQAELQMSRETFDLAIIDLKLSDKLGDESGFELLTKLKEMNPEMPVIVITQYYMHPDMVVKCMRGGAYYYFIKEKFNDGRDNFIQLVVEAIKYQPERESIEEKYPHPIALLYRDCKRNVVIPQLKFERLIQLLEVTLKFCGIVSLADFIQEGNADTKVQDFLNTKMSRPSLGRWNELLRLLDSLSNKNNTLWACKIHRVFNPKLRKAINELIQIRNENIGHGAAQPEHQYLSLIQACEPVIGQILQRASVIGTWDLFLVKASKKLSDREYQHSIVNLIGHNPKFLTPEKMMSRNLLANKVYVFDPGSDKILSLHPLIVVALCSLCGQDTMFFYDKFERDVVHYLDYVNGHHHKSVEFYRELHKIIPPRG